MQFIVLFSTCVDQCYMSTLKAFCIGSAYIDFIAKNTLANTLQESDSTRKKLIEIK